MHGQGTYAWEKKDQYTGEWQNNHFNGQGIFTYADGDKYVGEYKMVNNMGKALILMPMAMFMKATGAKRKKSSSD